MPAHHKRKPKDGRCVRLACWECHRDDYDGITPAELAALLPSGWGDVTEEQSYAASTRVYDSREEEPPGYSVLKWWTHIGTCPECAAHRDEVDAFLKAKARQAK